VIVLDNVRSHLNVGSIFRTADAYRVAKIYLCGITGSPPHRDIQKTALGATETIKWEYMPQTEDAIAQLKSEGYSIVSVEQADSASMLDQFIPENEKIALVFGNEVEGVSQQIINVSDYIIEIPQFGTKHSLNIAVSAGIVIWELSKRHFKHLKL
jgi:23S rRNA (guanosine2251-2'-O)-methyltransferase